MTKNWSFDEALAKFNLPFMDLLYEAQQVHRANFQSNTIQVSALLSIKTGGCSENCSYCAQSAHHKSKAQKASGFVSLEEVIATAKHIKEIGGSRFCMGASGRGPNDDDLEQVCTMIREVKKLGLETCVTLGLLGIEQAKKLKAAGLDYYNHNVDTSKDYYDKIVTTHTFEDRLQTLKNVRATGIKVCCGGIFGLGETNEDRVKMLVLLANLAPPPEAVPINKLIPMPGTPLEGAGQVDSFDFVRTIALARILLPKSYIRLAAGRENMSTEMQTLCFLAGANSIFHGEKLLTANNATPESDDLLLQRLGLKKV